MVENSYIKCLKCNTKNKDSDYCSNCGAIINIALKRHLEMEDNQRTRGELQKINGPDKMDQLLQQAARHPNAIIRGLFSTAHVIWTFLAMVIGALIAMVIAVAAG